MIGENDKMKKLIALFLTAALIFSASVVTAEHDPVLCAGGSFVYACDNQGNWYVWGDNQFGQLGRGNKTQKKVIIYDFTSKNEEIDPAHIRNAFAGCDYSYLLMDDGRIFGVGNGVNGCFLKGGVYTTHIEIPMEDKTIVTMAPGFGHTLALNEAGEVYAWGRNNAGQAGIGKKANPVREVTKLDLPKITAIAAGGKFSIALDENGVLWGWGDNTNHEIANTKDKTFYSPVQIDTGDLKIKMIDAGGSFVAIVDENGDLYTWGANEHSQCGFETKKGADVLEPTKVELPLPVKHISVYSGQAYAVLEDGSLWSWGNNSYGQLGVGYRSAASESVPITKVYDSGVVNVTVGSLFMQAMLEDGTVISTGMNKFGQLGREAPYWGDCVLQPNGMDLIK